MYNGARNLARLKRCIAVILAGLARLSELLGLLPLKREEADRLREAILAELREAVEELKKLRGAVEDAEARIKLETAIAKVLKILGERLDVVEMAKFYRYIEETEASVVELSDAVTRAEASGGARAEKKAPRQA